MELHLSGLIATASHPDTQKVRIIGFSLKMCYFGSSKFGCYYLQYVLYLRLNPSTTTNLQF